MSSSIKLEKNQITFSTSEYSNPSTQTTSFPSIGTMLIWAGDDATKLPSSYLPCDGRQLLQSTYASLYSVIGNKYTTNTNSSYFNIPDMQSRFAIGSNSKSTGELYTYTSGTTQGFTGGTKQITNSHFPHSHGEPIDISIIKRTASNLIAAESNKEWRTQGYSQSGESWTSTAPIGTSNTTSKDYYPPYCIFMYIIRAS